MIRPSSPDSMSATGFLKPPEMPRIATGPVAEFSLDSPQFDRPRLNADSQAPALDAGSQTPAQQAGANLQTLRNPVGAEDPLRDAFRDFVGQTLFGQMLSSMRSTVGKPAYFHGGRAEEVFSQQLDQVLVEQITDASASTVADPMFELFNMQRSR